MRKLVLLTLVLLVALLVATTASARVAHWGSFIGGDESFKNVTPFTLAGLEDAESVQASNSSGYAVAHGRAFAWGDNNHGQLGDGTFADAPSSPVEVDLPVDVTVVAVGEAKNEAVAVTSTGRVFGWGANESRSLCLRGNNLDEPQEVPDLSDVADAEGGNEHMLFLTTAGSVLGCGKNTAGELGLGEGVAKRGRPTLLPGVSGVTELSSGASFNAALTSAGEVLTWGKNEHGETGTGSTEPVTWTAVHVPLPEPAIEVQAGGDNNNGAVYALTTSDAVYGWGDGAGGAIPNSRGESQTLPVNTGLRFARVAAGGQDGFGITEGGELFGWGASVGGELGGAGGGRRPGLIQANVAAMSATAETLVALSR